VLDDDLIVAPAELAFDFGGRDHDAFGDQALQFRQQQLLPQVGFELGDAQILLGQQVGVHIPPCEFSAFKQLWKDGLDGGGQFPFGDRKTHPLRLVGDGAFRNHLIHKLGDEDGHHIRRNGTPAELHLNGPLDIEHREHLVADFGDGDVAGPQVRAPAGDQCNDHRDGYEHQQRAEQIAHGFGPAAKQIKHGYGSPGCGKPIV